MLKRTAVLLFVAVFGTLLANVSARAQEATVAVSVPFDFVVGQQTLSAGTYRVQKQGDFVSIRDLEGHSVFALLLAGGMASGEEGNPHLVFTRYPGQAFLNRVVFSDDRGFNLPRSSREKELISKVASGEEVAVEMQ